MTEALPDLMELITSLDEFQPTVPEELVQHFAKECGCEFEDPKLLRLLCLATQKFVNGVLMEALQVARMRDSIPFNRLKELGYNPRDKRRVLTLDDLVKALRECGVMVPWVPYYLDAKSGGPSAPRTS